MPVIEVVCFTGTSGLTDYSVSLARSLSALGQCRLVTATSLPDRFRAMGFEVLTAFRRSRHYPIDVLRFMRQTLKRKPDWQLYQGPLKWPLLDALAVRVLRWLGVRCAVTVHDVLPHYPRPWSRAEFGFYYRSFNRVIVHSQAGLAGVRNLGVIAPALVVPHGVYDLFCLTGIGQAEARHRVQGLGPGDVCVLFFGHVETRKGVFEFLQVAEALRTDVRFKFLIAGKPALTATELSQMLLEAERLGTVIVRAERIAFEEVENYFSASDIVALPYREGTTSGVLKLAIAFGKPVICSAVGDLPEELPADAGKCVPLGAEFVKEFAAGLLELANHYPAAQQAMRAGGEHQQWPDISQRVHHFLLEDARA